jgi:hypothetical protein
VAIKALAWLTVVVPWPVWRAVALVAGVATMFTGRRHVVEANVRHGSYGSPPPAPLAWWIAARQIANHVLTVIGTLRASVRLPDPGKFGVVGLDNLVPLLGERGVILVAPHAGPYTTLGIMGRQWLASQGFTGEMLVVARMFQPFRSRAVMTWFIGCLDRAQFSIVSVDEQPQKLAARLRKTLENKGIVVLLVDEPTPTPSAWVPFFDSAIQLPIGPARLARATGAVLLPVAASYAGGGRQVIHVAEGVEPSADPVLTLTQVARALERLVAPRLAQWSMLTPIWADAAPPHPSGWSAAELHLHTPGSDGLCAIDEWRVAAREAGIRVIAITDHDHLDTVRRWLAAHPVADLDVAVIPGVELTARGRIVHLGVLFPEEIPESLPPRDAPLPDLVRWARAVPGAIVVLVHPHPGLWRRQLRGLAKLGLLPDAIEVRYPLVGWQGRALEQAAARYGLAVLGGSDGHLAPGQLGRHVTLFPGETRDDLLAAIRTRRTRAATLPGAVMVPRRVYAAQSLYAWLLPFEGLPGVAQVRLDLLRRAKRAAEATAPRPVGVAVAKHAESVRKPRRERERTAA